MGNIRERKGMERGYKYKRTKGLMKKKETGMSQSAKR